MDFKSMKMESRILVKQILVYSILMSILIVGGLIYLYFGKDIPILEDAGRVGPYGLYIMTPLIIPIVIGVMGINFTSTILCENIKMTEVEDFVKFKSHIINFIMTLGIFITGIIMTILGFGIVVNFMLGMEISIFSAIGMVISAVLAYRRSPS